MTGRPPPPFPFRVLQRGLQAASRVGSAMVERVLRSEASLGPVPALKAPERLVNAPITVQFGEQSVQVPKGSTLLAAARSQDIDLRYYCGGNCSCGTCRVEILEGAKNLSKVESMEAFVLGEGHQRKGDRLACQAQVLGPVRVHIPEWF